MKYIPVGASAALEAGRDLEAIHRKSSLANIKVAKSTYYPEIALVEVIHP
jgi:hypothetical protein